MSWIESMLAEIPYLGPHGLSLASAEDDGVRVFQPFRREVTNYIGTVHAGALFTLAETAAGIAAFGVVPGGRAIVLLRSATLRYTRRADTDLTAEARVSPEAAEAARAAFEASSRADVPVEVVIAAAGGEPVFDATLHYALRPAQS